MSAFAHRAADLIGQTVDSYEIVEILGRGGMGVVYRAVDTSLDRTVALKMLHGHLIEDERFLLRFVAEAKALGRLQHPNIVNVFALRHVEPYLFLVMEYVDGGSLHDVLEQQGRLPWQEALPILRQALRGIAYAHAQHILHRDIKPSNLLLSRYGEVKVADLGLAKIQETADHLGLTRTGFTGGTLHYMPPEQLEGLRHVDHRSDLYALGMTGFKMLAGRTPFDGIESEFQVQKAIEAHDFPPVHHYAASVPPALADVISRATAPAPEDRYQDAADMLAALDAFAARYLPGILPHEEHFPYRSDTPVDYFAREEDVDAPEPPARVDEADAAPRTYAENAAEAEEAKTGADAPTFVRDATPPPDYRAPAPPGPAAPEPVHAAPEPVRAVPRRIAPAPRRPPPQHTASALQRLRRRPWALPVLAALGFFVVAAAVVLLLSGPEPAMLSVRTEPPGASVYLDRTLVGPAPVDYETHAGVHALRLEREGYVPLDTTVMLRPGGGPLTFALERATAPVVLTSDPPGAEVRFDGQLLGATPLRSLTLPTGPHTLVVRKYGYKPIERTFTVTPGRLNTFSAALEAGQPLFLSQKSVVELTSNPPADLYIGGFLVARDTARYTERLPRGTHALRAHHPSYGVWKTEVTIDDPAPQTVAFDFSRTTPLHVTSTPEEAEIVVDSVATGLFTPASVSLPPGPHVVAVQKEGYRMRGAPHPVSVDDAPLDPIAFPLERVE